MTSISSSSSSLSQILMQQMQKARTDMFNKADADSSGALSLDEFKAIGAKNPNATQDATQVEAMFTKLDTDGDGSLTQAEMDAGAPPQDIGMLSDKVLSALLEILGGDDSEATEETAQASAPPPPPPPTQTADSGSTETFDALDTNQDGIVSLDEIMAGLTAVSQSNDTASTDTTSKDNLIAELKTAVRSFLLSLQEQQQKQVA